jgi:hypothetical protein
MRNAHFPKVEASNKQVETQNGGNLTNNNKSTTTRNQKVMGKDRKKEAERQRKIRLNKKTRTKMLEAFWAYAEKKNPALRNEANIFTYLQQRSRQVLVSFAMYI